MKKKMRPVWGKKSFCVIAVFLVLSLAGGTLVGCGADKGAQSAETSAAAESSAAAEASKDGAQDAAAETAQSSGTGTADGAKESAAQSGGSEADAEAGAEQSGGTGTADASKEETAEESSASAAKQETAAPAEAITLENVRDYVVGLDEPVELENGTKTSLINFDNAATTPALKPVMDEVVEKMAMYGSIGRGFSQKSNYSTDLYNETRKKVLDFVGADEKNYTCFYVNNTTDGLNKLASALVESKDDVILATRIEHHANDLPWRERCKVIYAEVDDQGRVIYDEIEKQLKENKVNYVAVTAASNVTGYVTDVHRVAKLAHQYGAKIIVDGAQIVAHRRFSMLGETEEENIDFFVFSAHKMYSPFGGGAVVGLTEVLNQHMPEFYGGGIVRIVGDSNQLYKDAPERYEAGSPNYPGVVGLGKAIDILKGVGFDAITEHEQKLIRKLIDGLQKYDTAVIYGDAENISDRVGVVTFNFTDVNSHLLAEQISKIGGVATRRGAFCAHPYVWRLLGVDPNGAVDAYGSCDSVYTPGMIRISFGIYNTEEELDEFFKILPEAIEATKAETEKMNNDPHLVRRVDPEY